MHTDKQKHHKHQHHMLPKYLRNDLTYTVTGRYPTMQYVRFPILWITYTNRVVTTVHYCKSSCFECAHLGFEG